MRPSKALLILAFVAATARAQEAPIAVLRDWQFYNNTGWLYLNKGDYASAEKRFRAAIDLIRPYEVNDRRMLARSYGDLAEAFFLQKRHAEAEPLAAWALAVRERSPGVPPRTLRDSLYLLAQIHRARGRLDAAEPLYRRALAVQESLQGPRHPDTAQLLDDLATVCRDLGKLIEADPLYRRAAAIREPMLAAGKPDLAETAEHYAALLRKTNRAAEAERWEARALTIRADVEKAARYVREKEAGKTNHR